MARVGHGGSVLEPAEALSYINSRADGSMLLREWFVGRQIALGKEGMLFSAPYMPGARHLSRATESSPLPHSIPPTLAHIVQARREWMRGIFDLANEARAEVGLDPVKPRKSDEYTPHVQVERFAESYDDIFKQFAGRDLSPAEIRELKNRHLERREGDSKYVEDAAIQDYLYMVRMQKYISTLKFFKQTADWLRDNPESPRAQNVRDWIASTFFQKKDFFETQFDGLARMLTLEKGPSTVFAMAKDVVAKRLGVEIESLKPYESVYSVAHGSKVRATDPNAITFLGEKKGYDHYGVTNGHLVPAEPYQLKGYAKVALEGAVKLKQRLKDKLGLLDKDFHTLDEHEAAAISELNDAIQRYGENPVRAWTSLIGRNQVRAMLGGNISAVSKNLMNNALTTYPEFGLVPTLKGVRAEAKGTIEEMRSWFVDLFESSGHITKAQAESMRRAIKLTPSAHLAQAIGSLQGEVPRGLAETRRHLVGADKVYRRFLDAMNVMNPYRAAEDVTRGVDAHAAAVYGARMGLSPLQVRRIYNATQASRIALARELSKRIEDTSTAESFAAQMYAETMYDYGPLGQTNLHRTALGGLVGRLTTFPINYMMKQEYRPVAGAQAIGTATFRGVLRAVTRGAHGRRAPGAQYVWGPKGTRAKFQGASRYPKPQGARVLGKEIPGTRRASEWLEDGGAGWYQRHAASVFVRQLGLTGLLMGLYAGTGLNFFVVGTPAYHLVAAEIIAQLIPTDWMKRMVREMRRGVVVSYARGALPAGPILHLGAQVVGRAKGIPAKWRKLNKDDTEAAQHLWHLGQAIAEQLAPPTAEFMRQQLVPVLITLRRNIEINPEFWDRVDPDHFYYKLFGVKTVYEGLTPRERWLRNHDLLPQKRLDETKRKAIPEEAKGGGRGLPRMPGMRGLPKLRGAA
jgi:hypothetical protein